MAFDAKTGKPRTLLMRGVDALSRRDYSRLELERKLGRGLREGEGAEELEAALDVLQKRGYLDDGRYAKSRVRARAARYGNRRLAAELAMMGVASDEIKESLKEAGSEYERALALWRKKFGAPPEDRKARDKQVRYLASRGFDFDVISRVIEGAGDEEFEEDGAL